MEQAGRSATTDGETHIPNAMCTCSGRYCGSIARTDDAVTAMEMSTRMGSGQIMIALSALGCSAGTISLFHLKTALGQFLRFAAFAASHFHVVGAE